nr:mitotic checkpoint protein bub3.3 [Quercus suber]
MNGTATGLEIGDAISRIRFAPKSNNLLISSWDSVSLRLYDVVGSALRLEAPSEAALLDCCFRDDESVAFAAASDGCVRRYDLHSGVNDTIGNHDDIATSIGYSDETGQVISAGLDKKILFWDMRMAKAIECLTNLGAEVDSMSLFGLNFLVAIGSSIHEYDLRKLDKLVQSKESHLNIRIRCVSSIPYSKGYAVGSVDGRVAVEMPHPSNPNDISYMFRCHPKSKDGRYHLASVNDIVFNPFICGAFVTGDNEGYVTAWDARSKRRLFGSSLPPGHKEASNYILSFSLIPTCLQLPRLPNSVASLSYNHDGQLLAVASSYTYQEAEEIEEPPQVFIYKIDDSCIRSVSAGSSSRN